VKVVTEKSFIAEIYALGRALYRRDVSCFIPFNIGFLTPNVDYIVVADLLGCLLQPV
jgi:hypothetical protein